MKFFKTVALIVTVVIFFETMVCVQKGWAEQGEPGTKDNPLDFINGRLNALRDEYRKNKEEMTDVKFNEWWKEVKASIKGKYIFTEGAVEDVKKTWTGKLTVLIDLDDSSETGNTYEIELVMNPKKHSKFVSTMKKDWSFQFWGKVTKFDFVSRNLDIIMEDIDSVYVR